jgi:hypothetical protein
MFTKALRADFTDYINKVSRCTNPAIVRYTWPGQNECYVCAIHALGIQKIACSMGLVIQFMHLTVSEMVDHACSQKAGE